MSKEINVEAAKLEIMLDVCRRDKDALNFKLAAMQARIEKLENVAEKLANIIQWAMDDEEDFIYSTEGMAAIAELDKLKGDQ